MNFSRWVAGTLVGHLLGIAVVFSVPLLVWFLIQNYTDGTLTASFLVRFIVIDFLLGAVVATVCWYSITLPIIKKYKRSQR